MKYYYIEPEVAGGLGNDTVMNRSVHPPVVTKLHYQFDGWLGDVLLESSPCFIVTELAKQKLQDARLTGATFDESRSRHLSSSKSSIQIATSRSLFG